MDAPIAQQAFEERLYRGASAEEFATFFGCDYVVVELDGRDTETPSYAAKCPVIGVGDLTDIPDWVDAIAETGSDVDALTTAIKAAPIAAMTLVQLLRANERLNVREGLFAESLAYSTLQHSATFEAWLAARDTKEPRAFDDEAVLIERAADELHITLNRPEKRNAYSNEIREGLCSALQLADMDDEVQSIILRGAGRAFSAGGDLDEFGTARDAGVAHASRMTRNAGILLYTMRDRITVRVHGACIGAGIELPAFAGRIEAHADTFFQLPEVGMGLIPGAGGTVSIPRRIGRLRMAAFAMTGARVDARTALDWGLIDAIVD